MPTAVEQVWALVIREIRILLRSRGRLVCALAVPLAGGVVCGWMTRTTSLPPIYCLVVFLMLCGIILATDRDTRASESVRAIAGAGAFTAAWSIAALITLIGQSALLTACASLIGGFEVSHAVLAWVIVLSLAVSVGLHRAISAVWA